MGKAFNRMTRQVMGRSQTRVRRVPFPLRVAALEVLLLEVSAYLAVTLAQNPEDAADHALVEAYHEFKKHLEGTI